MMKNGKKVLLGLVCAAAVVFASCNSNPDVVPAKELCDKAEMAGLTTPVDSEAALKDLLLEMAKEMSGEDPARAAKKVKVAKTPEDALAQVEDYVKGFVTSVEDALAEYKDKDGNYDLDLSTISKIKFSFNFDKAIEIGEISMSDWIDTIAQACEDFYKEFEDEIKAAAGDDADLSEIFKDIATKKDEIMKEILDEIEVGKLKGKEAVAVLDKYFVLKRIGLSTKIIINVDMEKFMKNDKEYLEETMVDLAFSGKISLAVKNIVDFAKEISKNENVKCPVKGFSVYAEGDAAVTVTTKDVKSLMGLVTSSNPIAGLLGGTIEPNITACAVSGTEEIAAAICTESGKGGYFTITVEENVDATGVIDLIETALSNKATEDDLYKEINKLVKVTVSVSNGKKETFNKEYSFLELKKFLESLEPAEE